MNPDGKVDLSINEKTPTAVANAIRKGTVRSMKKPAAKRKTPEPKKAAASSRAKPSGAKKATAPSDGSPFLKDSRLPAVGTKIDRVYKGKTFSVVVREDGLEYEGEKFRSLSAVARKILLAGGAPEKTQVNGFLWWGLTKREVKTASAHRARRAPQTARKPRSK